MSMTDEIDVSASAKHLATSNSSLDGHMGKDASPTLHPWSTKLAFPAVFNYLRSPLFQVPAFILSDCVSQPRGPARPVGPYHSLAVRPMSAYYQIGIVSRFSAFGAGAMNGRLVV